MIQQIICGDCPEVMKTLESGSIHCCVTSPPYWGLRDYGVDGQLGLEKTPEEYVEKLVEIFREVKRVLRGDGTVWLNLGDSYWGGKGKSGYELPNEAEERRAKGETFQTAHNIPGYMDMRPSDGKHPVLKPKDIVGIPWRVALALQADGWYLRQDIIWHKPNPMPESVRDRCTKAHEYIFLLSKSKRYYYDQDAIRENNQDTYAGCRGLIKNRYKTQSAMKNRVFNTEYGTGRNKHSVWTVPTKPFKEAHFAVFPPDLIRPCILAGTSVRGCCPECGAPWERITERKTIKRDDVYEGSKFKDQDKNFSHKRLQMMVKAGRAVGLPRDNPLSPKKTIGWRPTCKCGDEYEPIPCTVLDPFFGAGTTGVVAKDEGRGYIGIELNPDYCEMARKRINAYPERLI